MASTGGWIGGCCAGASAASALSAWSGMSISFSIQLSSKYLSSSFGGAYLVSSAEAAAFAFAAEIVFSGSSSPSSRVAFFLLLFFFLPFLFGSSGFSSCRSTAWSASARCRAFFGSYLFASSSACLRSTILNSRLKACSTTLLRTSIEAMSFSSSILVRRPERSARIRLRLTALATPWSRFRSDEVRFPTRFGAAGFLTRPALRSKCYLAYSRCC